jgi:hypothetical protein
MAAVFGGLVTLGGSAVLLSISSKSASPVHLVIVLLVCGLVYLGMVYLALRNWAAFPIWYITLIAVCARLILLPSQPLFDDDIHRYIWDGRVMSYGVNPYAYAPADNHLAGLRDANWAHIGYPEIRTIYPPAAQALFGAAYRLGITSIFGFKFVFFLFDLGNILMIIFLLGKMGLPKQWAIVYAWSPIAIKEFANSGHLEPVMLFFLLAVLYLWTSRGTPSVWAGILFAISILVKGVPILLIPPAFRLMKWRSSLACMAVVVLAFLPFSGAGFRVLSGSGMYARYWEFNGSLFALLSGLMRHLTGDASWVPVVARVVAALAIVCYGLYSAARMNFDDPGSWARSFRNVLALSLFVMPTADPWYVCWLLPFLCIVPNRGLMLLTVMCSLSYLYYAHQTFPVWIPVIEYAPVYGLLVLDLVTARRSVGKLEKESGFGIQDSGVTLEGGQ